MEKLRIDKWLWAARFYKTRSLAGEEIDKGRVRVNDVEAKPAKEVKVGDVVAMRSGPTIRTVTVLGISGQRVCAPSLPEARCQAENVKSEAFSRTRRCQTYQAGQTGLG